MSDIQPVESGIVPGVSDNKRRVRQVASPASGGVACVRAASGSDDDDNNNNNNNINNINNGVAEARRTLEANVTKSGPGRP